MMMKKMFQDKEADESPFGNMGSKKLKNGKLHPETHPAYSRNSTSSIKTKTSISAAWSNPLSVENGENSQTNGSRNNTSRTAAPAPPSLTLSQNCFRRMRLGRKVGKNHDVLPMRKGYQIQDLHEPRHETQIRKELRQLGISWRSNWTTRIPTP